MTKTSFTLAVLKPEIASGYYNFTAVPAAAQSATGPTTAESSRDDNNGDDPSESPENDSEADTLRSSIPGVSAVEAALLYPNGQILPTLFARVAKAGFVVHQKRMLQFTKAQVRFLFSHELHYRLNNDETQSRQFLEHFTSGPSLALLLAFPESTNSDDALVKWNQLAGHVNPVVARQEALSSSLPHDEWPLRALCGLNAVQNGIQSSATLDCFHRERFLVFPSPLSLKPLERAVVVLLPTFLSAWPEGKALLVAKLNAGGVVVAKSIDDYRVSPREAKLLMRELHPFTNAQHREEYAHVLLDEAASSSCLLELEGLDLFYALRSILGPASPAAARMYFPESIRAHLASTPFPCLEYVKTVDNDSPCLETGLFVSFDAETIRSLLLPRDEKEEGAQRIERTFAIIKPGTASDPVAVHEIQSAIRAFGFTIETQRRMLLTRAQASAFYGEHRGKVFFERLVAFMTSGELVAMQLARKNAIVTWRALMGPTNAIAARETHPWTLRARFGVDGTRNATHGSDAKTSARRELRFFFGGTSSAFGAAEADASAMKEELAAVVAAKRIARDNPLPSPYPPAQTLESVLTEALDEMLQLEAGNQLDVCRWLGNWLLAYSQRQQLKQQSSDSDHPQDHRSIPHRNVKGAQIAVSTKAKGKEHKASDRVDQLFGCHRTIIAISYSADVQDLTRAAIRGALQQLAAPRFVFLDVASELQKHSADVDSGIASLVKQMEAAGSRRFVLHDVNVEVMELFAAKCEWRANFMVAMESPIAAASSQELVGPWVPRVSYQLAEHAAVENDLAVHDSKFTSFFSAMLSPTIVLVHDAEQLVSPGEWSHIAEHFGFTLLTYDGLIRLQIVRERDPNGVFTQLQRTHASISPDLLLGLLRAAIRDFHPTSANEKGENDDDEKRGIAQKFLVCGFPLDKLSPAAFENHVGAVFRVLRVQKEDGKVVESSTKHALDAWIAHTNRRGAVADLWVPPGISTDRNQVLRTLASSCLQPVIGFCVGEDRRESSDVLAQLKEVARVQGFVWLDVDRLLAVSSSSASSDPDVAVIAKLKRVLLRSNAAGREKFLLHGFPRSKEAARAFIGAVGIPTFVIQSTRTKSSSAEDLLSVFDAYPQIVQFDVASAPWDNANTMRSMLQGLLFGKKMSFVVGDVADVKSVHLRSLMSVHGYATLDLRPSVPRSDSCLRQVDDIVRQIRAIHAPRCLLLGGPEHLTFFQALEAVVGSSMEKIVVLKQVEPQPPPRARRDTDEDYYSDDEDELERQRQRKAQTVSPELEELLQHYAITSHARRSGIAVSKVTFLKADKAYASIRVKLVPHVVGVVGNPFTFYRDALKVCARRHQLGVAHFSALQLISEANQELKGGSTCILDQDLGSQLRALQRLIAATPCATYFVDGFPCSAAEASQSQAPYVAQQLWALEESIAPMRSLVQFTASVDVLAERKPATVSRSMLEDAQDTLEAQTSDVLAFFASHRSRQVLRVACERELVDAQKELEDALVRAAILDCPRSS